VPLDDAEAVKWYRKAAEQGHAEAQYKLGLSYRYGVGVPEDAAESARWFRIPTTVAHVGRFTSFLLHFLCKLNDWGQRRG